jgi:hypothetical protein
MWHMDYITIPQVATVLEVSRQRAHQLMPANFSSVMVDGRILVQKRSVDAYLDARLMQIEFEAKRLRASKERLSATVLDLTINDDEVTE